MNKKYPTFFLTWFDKFSRVPYPGNLVWASLWIRRPMPMNNKLIDVHHMIIYLVTLLLPIVITLDHHIVI